jgi:hypothetical protein
MIFDSDRHEALVKADWSESLALAQIQHIVRDTQDRFDSLQFWPVHPHDTSASDLADTGKTALYHGACGVIWAMHYLQGCGAVSLDKDYLPHLEGIRARNQEWLGTVYDEAAPSYLMGDTPFRLLELGRSADHAAPARTLHGLLASNLDHPHRDLMWGSPGTMLGAWFLHTHTGDAQWADVFRQTAAKLWSQLLWSDEFQCHYWTQDMYGRQSSYLDGVHGFVATASVLIKGRDLLEPQAWRGWEDCIVNTMEKTASVENGLTNWRAHLLTPSDEVPRLLMQICHGAPGFVVCLSALPSKSLDSLLLGAGEAIWQAGPLVKGANLCHGTAGNGYAFLKLFERTGDAIWLQRARAFAMHAVAQSDADRAAYGQGNYALWTGDLGLAIFLWDCVSGKPQFPTLDVFFAPG